MFHLSHFSLFPVYPFNRQILLLIWTIKRLTKPPCQHGAQRLTLPIPWSIIGNLTEFQQLFTKGPSF